VTGWIVRNRPPRLVSRLPEVVAEPFDHHQGILHPVHCAREELEDDAERRSWFRLEPRGIVLDEFGDRLCAFSVGDRFRVVLPEECMIRAINFGLLVQRSEHGSGRSQHGWNARTAPLCNCRWSRNRTPGLPFGQLPPWYRRSNVPCKVHRGNPCKGSVLRDCSPSGHLHPTIQVP
jgi:hypothetical protein